MPRQVAPRLDAIEIDARSEVQRRWGRIQGYLVEFFRHQGIDAVVAEELALMPGAEEVTALLAIEQYANSGNYDLVVLDCAPTDATLRLVTLPDVAHGALRVLLPIIEMVSGLAVPIAKRLVEIPLPDSDVFGDVDTLVNQQLRRLHELVSSEQTSVRLVVTPERMVIDEARRAWTELALFDVRCDAVVMNRLLPAEAADEPFFAELAQLQGERLREVEQLFAPHPVLLAPLQDDEATGLERLAQHGEALFADVQPEALLSSAPRLRFERAGSGYRALVPLPGATASELEVVKVADELTITTGVRRRAIKLPQRMAALDLHAARLDKATLVVELTRPAEAS